MKTLALFFATIIAAVVVVPGCNKKTATSGSGTIYKGVVSISMCGNIAIETLGPDYLGEATWSAGNGSREYHHVFSVQNSCSFGAHAAGDTIHFKLVESQVQNCAQCMIYVAVPATKYAVQVID